MFQLIEKLRQKPEGTKRRIAFWTSFAFSTFIFLIWLTVVLPDVSFVEKQKQKAKVPETGAISIFLDNIKQSFGSIKEEAGIIKNIVSDVVTNVSTTTHYSLDNKMSNDVSSTTSLGNNASSTY